MKSYHNKHNIVLYSIIYMQMAAMFEEIRAAYLILLAILASFATPNLVLTLLLGFASFLLPLTAFTGIAVPVLAA